MKVQELLEFVGNPKNKLLKEEQLKTVIQKQLEVKEYLSIKEKKQLVDKIVDDCILYEDGIFKFDDIDKYICFIMNTICAYTNLELSDDIEEDYDVLCSAKILELIIDTFKKEYDDVNILLQMKCDYILSGNSIEAQVGKFLNGILEKIDSFSEVLSEKIKDFDFEKLNIDKKDIGKLMSFINKIDRK
jgi:hypothetical protein